MSLLIIFDCWNCVLMAVYLLNCQIAWPPGWTIHENYFQRNYSTLSAALNFKRKKPAAYVCVRYICLSSSAVGSYMLLSSEEALHLIRWKLCVHPQMRCPLPSNKLELFLSRGLGILCEIIYIKNISKSSLQTHQH